MKYYHITHPNNMDSINKHGLRPREGWIFVLSERDVAPYVAAHQLLLEDYALYELHWTGPVTPDEVAEVTAVYQWIIKTDMPLRANLVGCWKVM